MAAGSRVTPRSCGLHNIKSAESETTATDSRRGLTCNVSLVTDGVRGRELTRLLNLSTRSRTGVGERACLRLIWGCFQGALLYVGR